VGLGLLRLPREVVEPPSLEILKNRLDTVLDNMLKLILLGSQKVPPSLNGSMILWFILVQGKQRPQGLQKVCKGYPTYPA